ncbi:hypothetical protein BS78_10G127600 [Paspalum vaginatum]|nr:hypothetical protein BS78_10G127600 [Paspalum vaginatum]
MPRPPPSPPAILATCAHPRTVGPSPPPHPPRARYPAPSCAASRDASSTHAHPPAALPPHPTRSQPPAPTRLHPRIILPVDRPSPHRSSPPRPMHRSSPRRRPPGAVLPKCRRAPTSLPAGAAITHQHVLHQQPDPNPM